MTSSKHRRWNLYGEVPGGPVGCSNTLGEGDCVADALAGDIWPVNTTGDVAHGATFSNSPYLETEFIEIVYSLF